MNEKEVQELLGKARQSIAAAETLLKDRFYDFSASRSYYAMFYSVEALFLYQNRSFSKHKAVISAFGKEFIKTGIFPTEYHRYILDAFDLRNLADYGTIHSVNKDQAKELIQNAKALIDATQAYLTKKP
jgi:uncharacterized protein (UPF0332 family)